MDIAVLYSDMAIIVYEILVICILGFFVARWSKEKKKIMQQDIESAKKKQEEILRTQLKNEKRR